MFDTFFNIGYALAKAAATKYALVLENGLYRINRDGKTVKIISRTDMSDMEYKAKAIKEFDKYVQDQNEQNNSKTQVIKTAYV